MTEKDARREADRLAREYIDKIAAINRRYGNGVSKERYDRAVEEAARVFRSVRPGKPT